MLGRIPTKYPVLKDVKLRQVRRELQDFHEFNTAEMVCVQRKIG